MKIQAHQQMCTGLTSLILLLGGKLIKATSALEKCYQNAIYQSTLFYLCQQSFALYWYIKANLCKSSFTSRICQESVSRAVRTFMLTEIYKAFNSVLHTHNLKDIYPCLQTSTLQFWKI